MSEKLAHRVTCRLLEIMLRVEKVEEAAREIKRAVDDAWSAVAAGHCIDNFTETRLREGLLRLCNQGQELAHLRERVARVMVRWNAAVKKEMAEDG